MKRQNYFPSRISQQVIWLNHFAQRVVVLTNAIGGDVDAANSVQLDALWLAYVLGTWLSEVRAFNLAATEYLDAATTGDAGTLPVFSAPPLPAAVAPDLPATVPRDPGGLTRIFDFVQKFKNTKPGYTDPIGADLGVIGAEDTADHPTPKVTLEVEQGPTCQCVDFTITKYTHEGVVIESRRGGAWEQIGLTTARTFEDARALLDPTKPEVREYRVRYWDKGTANGPWSEVMKATVAP